MEKKNVSYVEVIISVPENIMSLVKAYSELSRIPLDKFMSMLFEGSVDGLVSSVDGPYITNDELRAAYKLKKA